MLFSYQPYAIFMKKKYNSNIFKNDNNTNYYNNFNAHLAWITNKTRANTFCHYHVLRLILKYLSR